MKFTKTLVLSAMSMAIASAASAHDIDMSGKEKCYGVVKAGKNDCSGANNSCSGMSKKDGEGFIAVAKGECEKLIGGTLTAPAKK